ncbi:type II toxin-antitoxin system mRNA interferase toxin, RelE/StbE family [Candidatus Kaiserbacteria bacterium]|nr:type II toxin-antitoxin system mRNA interferase toxin, RelE/StbE family [Candidatus Kaiserbacteria bacterium]MCB9812477.1 type II toxin-antitoxin system mRNA interferase toxin, RelE/StbE family [Candidatus Nomurabacteria bacterium]
MRIAKSKQFEKQYKKLPAKTKEQFAERLTLFLQDKNHSLLHTHSLKGKYTGLWSFDVTADIRVIFDDSYEGVLILVATGSHSELYG